MARIDEYFQAPHPPPVRGLVVVTYAIVRDDHDRVLLVRRLDDGNWELPGGRVEVGETASTTTLREVAEESGKEPLPAITDSTNGDECPRGHATAVPGPRPPSRDAISPLRTPQRYLARRTQACDVTPRHAQSASTGRDLPGGT